MENEKYIDSLENLLIFMCQTYEERQQVLFKLAKKGNTDPLFKLPTIQGFVITMSIKSLSKMELKTPQHGFKDVLKRLTDIPESDKETNDELSEDEAYIQSIENILIYMCQAYQERQEVLKDLSKEGNKAALREVPTIQGSYNRIPISEISKLGFSTPIKNISEIATRISAKRLKPENNTLFEKLKRRVDQDE